MGPAHEGDDGRVRETREEARTADPRPPRHRREVRGDLELAVSDVPGKISATHQDGGTGNHGAKIPARPFLWLSMNFLSTAEDVMSRRMLDAFGGG